MVGLFLKFINYFYQSGITITNSRRLKINFHLSKLLYTVNILFVFITFILPVFYIMLSIFEFRTKDSNTQILHNESSQNNHKPKYKNIQKVCSFYTDIKNIRPAF